MHQENFGQKPEHIERVRIPDDDAHNWIAVLRESGFTDEEIDELMANLNVEYARVKKKGISERRIEEMAEDLARRHNMTLTEYHKKLLKKSLEDKFEEEAKRNSK